MTMRIITLLSFTLLCSCTLGPDYKRPGAVNDSDWQKQQSSHISETSVREQLWWQQLHDPLLDTLISEAAGHNRDLAVALANIEQAKAARRIAASGFYPTIDASVSGNRNRYSRQNAFAAANSLRNTFSAGLDASWELDLLGRTKRMLESADARLQAEQANRDGIELTVLAETASAYFELRGLQKQRANLIRNIELLKQVEAIARAQFEAGTISRLDLTRAEGEREKLAAQLPDLETQIASRIHRIAVLAGKPPEHYRTRLLESTPIALPNDPIPVGLRSDILMKRPDIRMAERDLAAASAEIGVAKADMYPRFSLTGAIGSSARVFSDLFTGNTITGAIGAALGWPVYAGGSLTAGVDAAEAAHKAALASYEQSVLLALEDAENALIRYGMAWQRLSQLQAAEKANRRAFEIANLRYQAGEESFMVILDAERTLLTTENEIIAAETAVLTNLTQLYKALGGSWLQTSN